MTSLRALARGFVFGMVACRRAARAVDEVPMTHKLKCWPTQFAAVVEGRKPFEWRKEDDRRFEVGDLLVLNEYDPTTSNYTGAITKRWVTYVLRGHFGVPAGYAVLGLKV